MTAPSAAPAELPVVLHPAVRRLAGGRVLLGGSPFRVLALTDAGARVVAGWRRPAPVGPGSAARGLARRLLDAGLLVPRPTPASTTAGVGVVVPVHDRPVQLARCLDAIRAACPESPVIVVDDGSPDPRAIAAACAGREVTLLRDAVSRGPAAARNRGLAACATPFVAFVDSDVVVPPGAAHRLLGHLADPAVGAVAPRVRALEPSRGAIGGYERRHSALDMGPAGALVAPGRALSYVSSTVLVARRDAIGAGFDPALRTGEDVDLSWRLWRAGWQVRYAAEIEVHHEHRVQLRAFVAGRRQYARSAGVLARRHPRALPAMWVSPLLAATWIMALAGRPRAAVAAAGWATARRAGRLRRIPGPSGALAGLVLLRGLAGTGLALAHAARRPWCPPLLVLSLRRPRVRAGLLAAFAVPVIQDALATRDLRTAGRDAPLRLLEEVVAAAAIWEGCVRAHTLRPLLPAWRPPRRAAP